MSYAQIKIGDKAPEVVTTVIEIPRGSHMKYEYDEEMDEIKLDRVLHSPVFYAANYGFIPETRSEDGDHLDIMVVMSESLFPGCVCDVRPVGVLDMDDQGEKDWKIIGVAKDDPVMKNVQDIKDLNQHELAGIKHFMSVYKELEGKKVIANDWLGKADAYRIIKEGIERETARLNK